MSDDVVRPVLLQVLYVGPTCWAAPGRSQPTSKTITVHQVAARGACYLFLAVPLKANTTLTLRPSVGAIRWVGEELGFVVHQLHVVDRIRVCCGGGTELSIFRHPRGDTKERHRRRSRKEAHELQQVNHDSSPRVLHNEDMEALVVEHDGDREVKHLPMASHTTLNAGPQYRKTFPQRRSRKSRDCSHCMNPDPIYLESKMWDK
eukprot:CAMPEP_0194544184 /NCGR_PEP_ID=MMETSP0253-20130528/87106_1 /TAXON_ID=2966 /ORGANISM="Noctiluca scintillans" /LENGTH=203 /DNA_ID=CAMNT_0039391037 /DNA_START=441 /DNA_END=1053 /DNA_ORIENTATION=+